MIPFPRVRRSLAVMAAFASWCAAISAQTSSWVPIGDEPFGLFAVSPDYAVDATIFGMPQKPLSSETGSGPVHVSVDHGDSFTFLSQVPNVLWLHSFTVSPTFSADRTIFMSTAESGVGVFLWKSQNAGASWQKMPGPAPGFQWGNAPHTFRMSPNFASDKTVLFSWLAGGGSTWRSIDGGQSWVNGSPTLRSTDLRFAADFATSKIIMILSTKYHGFLRSEDAGLTYKTCQQYTGTSPCGVSFYDELALEVPVLGSGPNRVVFAAGDSGPLSHPNMYRSLDYGFTFEPCGIGLGGLAIYCLKTPPDFHTSGTVWAGTSQGMYVSHDRGVHFAPLAAAGLPSGAIVDLQLGGDGGGDLFALTGPTPNLLYRLRLSGTGVVELGGGVAGASGVPEFAAEGPFGQPSALHFQVDSAAPSATGAYVFGLTQANAPLLGGVLVPTPTFIVPFVTNGSGSATLNLGWPASTAPGTTGYAQAWLFDAGAAQGVAASDGLKLTKL